MAKYLIELKDPETGEIEEIDTIRTDRDYYTAEDYLYDCSRFEEEDFLDTLCAGEIIVTRIRGNRKRK